MILPALVFASGAAALIYESVWARWLMLGLGAGSASVAVALAGTMLGLGLGGVLGGRLADRLKRPGRAYALCELAIAAAALAASALLRGASAGGMSPAAAFVLLLAPNALMGATLPLLAAHLARSRPDWTREVGFLYAANTAGAVAGVLLSGFALIENLGLWKSVWIGAGLNCAAALLALRLKERAVSGAAALEKNGMPVPTALFAAGVSGFCTMAYEVIDLRLLIHGFLATTHALAVTLACFLAGLALGARLCSGRLSALGPPARALGIALIAAAALSLAFGPSLTDSSALAAFLRDADWSFRVLSEAGIAAATLLPATVAMGFALPLATAACARGDRPGRSVGDLLWVNTLASVAGALCAAFVLLPALGLRGSLALVAVGQAAAGAWLLDRGRAWGWAVCAALAAGGAAWARPPRLGQPPGAGTLVPQQVVGRETEHRVLCYGEDHIATTAVIEHLPTGRKDLFIDGFVTAGDAPQAGYMALMGSLPALLHPAPQRGLVICFGTGSTARALARAVHALDLVDINPKVFECAPSFSPENSALLSRARVFVEDGRRYLLRTPESYDVITQEPMPPHFAGTAALYSVEYYRLARRRLAPGGLLVQWLPLHLVAPRDARQIVAAVQAVFPETWVALAPGDRTGLVIGSSAPLDPGRLRAAERALKVDFVLDPGRARRYAAGEAPVTDDRPSLEYSGIDRVRGRFRSSSALHLHNLEALSMP